MKKQINIPFEIELTDLSIVIDGNVSTEEIMKQIEEVRSLMGFDKPIQTPNKQVKLSWYKRFLNWLKQLFK